MEAKNFDCVTENEIRQQTTYVFFIYLNFFWYFLLQKH